LRELAGQVAEQAPEVAGGLRKEGLRHGILGRLVKGLTERAGQCAKALDG